MVRMSRALPAGLVTFVFTDIEGSTRLHQGLGPRYRELIAAHDRLLSEVFEGAGGCVVTRMGDGLFAAFPQVLAAVRACVVAQQCLKEQVWPEGAEVRVRMGMHCGQAVPVGDNYVALAVHQAARVSAAGHGGQVLLSGACAADPELTKASEIAVRRLGEFRLKDFDLAESVWQVSVKGEEPVFAALRVPPVGGHNLRVGRTSFVGRDKEIRLLQEALGQHRLLTILGPGGVGKSRLATRVAAETPLLYRDGVRAVGLVAATDAESVTLALAEALGVSPGASTHAAVREWIGEKELLLLIDNCEHVLAAIAEVLDDLLDSCPGLRVLATSREPLRLQDEYRWRITPLAVPPAGADAGSLLTYDSVRLFLQRAEATHAGFTVTPAEMEDAAAICRLLDGLPLALELAAAQVGRQPLAQLATRLRDGASLGDDRQRASVPHHRTLRAVVDWSVRLLHDQQRAALTVLSFLPAGFDETTAATVLVEAEVSGDPVTHVGDLLDASLLQRGTDDRYVMLETIRQNAQTRSDPEQEVARRAVLRWASMATAGAEELYDRGDRVGWRDITRLEHDNWIDCLRWASAHAPPAEAATLARNLVRHFTDTDHYNEGLTLIRPLVERLSLADEARPRLLSALGGLEYQRFFNGSPLHVSSEIASGISYLEEAMPLLRSSGDLKELSIGLNRRAAFHSWMEQYAEADACLTEALSVAERAVAPGLIARIRINLGVNAHLLGSYHDAVVHYLVAENLASDEGDWPKVALAESNLAEAYEALGDTERALRYFHLAKDHAREEPNASLFAWISLHLARLTLDAEDLPSARAHAQDALAAAREVGKQAFADKAHELLSKMT